MTDEAKIDSNPDFYFYFLYSEVVFNQRDSHNYQYASAHYSNAIFGNGRPLLNYQIYYLEIA